MDTWLLIEILLRESAEHEVEPKVSLTTIPACSNYRALKFRSGSRVQHRRRCQCWG
jgi:hypothetical protein